MDGGSADLLQFGHPTAYVGAVRVVAFRLRRRIQHAVRPAVRAGPRDPLPVELVVGDVPVHQQVQEVARPDPPVHVQRLDEEGGGQQPPAVVHPALVEQLAHGGVDQGVAGAARLPRLDVVRRRPSGTPPVAPRTVVGVGHGRAGGQDLVVEVPPAQLPDERLGAGAARRTRPVDQFGGGDRAEVEMRGEPGGRVRGQVVVTLLVPAQPLAAPGGHPPAALLLTAVGQPLRHPSHPGPLGHRPGRRAVRYPHGARRTDRCPQTYP